MTYAGITIADKPALEDAKADGKKILTMAFSDRVQVVDIDIALAQIAELESAEKPLTWNERINQMTAEEKATFLNRMAQNMYCPKEVLQCRAVAFACEDCADCLKRFLNSPYTEGETE